MQQAPVAPPDAAPPERRHRYDRRQRPTSMLSRHTIFGGRRNGCRRDDEARGAFVDNHGTLLFVVVTAVAAFNVLDALFTVLFLSYGGREINPLVAASLDSGMWVFLTMKSLGIGACVVFLSLTKNFRVSRIGLGVVFVGYTLLMLWHLWLYMHLPTLA